MSATIFNQIRYGTAPTLHREPRAVNPVTPRQRRHRAKLRAADLRDYLAETAASCTDGASYAQAVTASEHESETNSARETGYVSLSAGLNIHCDALRLRQAVARG